MSNVPSIGRIVHFFRASGASDWANGPHAAIITDTHVPPDGQEDGGAPNSVRLQVFYRDGRPSESVATTLVDAAIQPAGEYCIWPPRVG